MPEVGHLNPILTNYRFLSHSLLSIYLSKWGRNEKNIVKDVLFLGQSQKKRHLRIARWLWLQDTLNAHLLECRFSSQYDRGEKTDDYHPNGKWNLVLFNRFSLKRRSLTKQRKDACPWAGVGRPLVMRRFQWPIEIWIGKQKQFICQAFRLNLSAWNGCLEHYYLKMKDGVDSAPFFDSYGNFFLTGIFFVLKIVLISNFKVLKENYLNGQTFTRI